MNVATGGIRICPIKTIWKQFDNPKQTKFELLLFKHNN